MGSIEEKVFQIQHRSRWDIMANVLSAAITGRTKTYVKQKCNLSYRQLRAYMSILCERGLLMAEFHKGKSNYRRVFVTTDKGHAFLKAYGSLRATIEKGILKLHLEKLRAISTH